jgi:hypothetical protein
MAGKLTRNTGYGIRVGYLALTLAACTSLAHAQDTLQRHHADSLTLRDSLATPAGDTGLLQPEENDTVMTAETHNPRTAALFSAVVPGLGQAYNHKYWKIPIAYAGLGAATSIFVFNYKEYIRFRNAYRLSFSGQSTGDAFVDQYDPQDQKRIRDIYRQYVDYSALGFMGVYLINIVDAIVDAHLYNFSVSDDLGFKLGPVYHPGYVGYGITIQLDKKKRKRRSAGYAVSSASLQESRRNK